MFVVLNQVLNLETDMVVMAISIFALTLLFVSIISIISVVILKNRLPKDSFIKLINSIFGGLIIVVIVLLVTVRFIVLMR